MSPIHPTAWRRARPVVAAGLLALCALAACKREEPEQTARAAKQPEAAVAALAQALREDDVLHFSRLSLPPELRTRMAERWKAERARRDPPSEKDRREYAELMTKLTAPDAETRLYAELEPELARMERELSTQLPLMVGMGSGLANAGINASPQLGAEQKKHASAVVDALAAWLMRAPLTDRTRAREAIAAAADTARKLDLKTVDAVQALDYDPAMQKAGVAIAGVKKIINVYGLDADRSLASVKARTLSSKGDRARIVVSYTLLDKPVKFEMAMVARGGHWYSAEAIASAERELAEPVGADAARTVTAAD